MPPNWLVKKRFMKAICGERGEGNDAASSGLTPEEYTAKLEKEYEAATGHAYTGEQEYLLQEYLRKLNEGIAEAKGWQGKLRSGGEPEQGL